MAATLPRTSDSDWTDSDSNSIQFAYKLAPSSSARRRIHLASSSSHRLKTTVMAPVPFLPQDSELLDCLLRPKIAGAHIDSRFTELVGYVDDVYALPPDQLAARHEGAPGEGGGRVWYFFAPLGTARGRTVGGDGGKRWCSVGSRKKVEGGAGAGGGYCQKLRYTEKTASGVVAPGWMMAQYSVAQENGGEGGAELLLCKIFRAPRAARAEPGSPSSCKSVSASPSASCSGTGSGGRKRKAEGDHLEASTTLDARAALPAKSRSTQAGRGQHR
ncbi:NAC domain-containing protein 72-like [Oryza brachyantha]|uniref:NAC domain-containing protein 72-like n=1 Tax=Oryza brachyantha TaxID=4533 RepID=UPI001ADD1CB6|nr:NAC domain-containing protein 72-like [Oryza brachyantha]